ncbi:MAG: hypothetical protein U1G08_17855 [Verrucomicrobiota bacterium]
MNSDDREQLRLSLLRFLDANATGRFLGTGLLHQMAKAEGRGDLTGAEVEGELRYLLDKGFVEMVAKQISPENKTWRITASGRDAFAQL